MKKIILSLLIISMISACAEDEKADEQTETGLLQYASSLTGTDSERSFSHGNTYPAVALPFGMTAWTPQTGEFGWIYQYKSTKIQGFRATHQPSPWIGDYGQFSLMPMTDSVRTGDEARASEFSHENEIAKPNYYKVKLDKYNITGEISPTERCALMRFKFPENKPAFMVIDAAAGEGSVRISADKKRIYGFSRSNSGGTPPNFTCYFVIEFDADFKTFGTADKDQIYAGKEEITGRGSHAFAEFEAGKTVTARIGTSFISEEQAVLNLEKETAGKDFETVKKEAAQSWEDAFGRIVIKTKSEEEYRTFYSCFYRALLFPRKFYEIDNQGDKIHYSPYDGKIHDGPMYVDNGFWDTFRAVFPFFTLVFPEQEKEMLEAFLNTYKEGGRFPKWTSPGYRSSMIGTHGTVLFADAFAKGIDFDLDLALEASVKDALAPSEGGGRGREGLEFYKKLGYVPSDKVHEATARTLEFAYDDFCTGLLAKAAGREKEANYFFRKSYNYKNVFDKEVGFMRGRESSGNWRPDFDAFEWGGPFTEGGAWHYSWSVLHDPAGLSRLTGGDSIFSDRLEEVFETEPKFSVGAYGAEIHEMTEMVAGKTGQYAHGNQPVHHFLYLQNYAGFPYKSQPRIRDVLSRLYGPGPDGYCGDEDNGQMSAWYLFSSLGFYPASPGHAEYATGSPLFESAIIKVPGRKELKLTYRGQSPDSFFVKNLIINKKENLRSFITHDELTAGGEIIFEMSKSPNPEFGREKALRPRSLSDYLPEEKIEPDETYEPAYIAVAERPEISGSDDLFFQNATTISIGTEEDSARIFYTLDGNWPDENSLLYEQNFSLEKSAVITAKVYRKGKSPSVPFSREFVKINHDYSLKMSPEPAERYTAGGVLALADGREGSASFGDGRWIGIREDFEVTVDLKSAKEIRKTEAGFLRDQGSWIFLPQKVSWEGSADGKNFHLLGEKEIGEPESKNGAEIFRFSAEFKAEKLRFLRMRVKSIGNAPDRHPAAGKPVYIFTDEFSFE